MRTRRHSRRRLLISDVFVLLHAAFHMARVGYFGYSFSTPPVKVNGPAVLSQLSPFGRLLFANPDDDTEELFKPEVTLWPWDSSRKWISSSASLMRKKGNWCEKTVWQILLQC